MPGLESGRFVNISLVIMEHSQSSIATKVAERGLPSISPISPKDPALEERLELFITVFIYTDNLSFAFNNDESARPTSALFLLLFSLFGIPYFVSRYSWYVTLISCI